MTINTARAGWAMAIVLAATPFVASAQEPPPQPPSATEVQGLLNEPNVIVRAIDFATRTMGDGSSDKSGFYPEMSMITGAGWITLGPGYRYWHSDRLFVDGAAAMSWREYKTARGRIEFANMADRRLAIGAEVKWQDFTQNTYFGTGPDSIEDSRSEYRLKSLDAVGYGNVNPLRWLTVGVRSGWLRSPELLEPTGKFRRDNPATQTVFPGDAAFQLTDQPDYGHSELFILADTRDRRSHPLDGGAYRASLAYFSDRSGSNFSFHRYELEGAHFKTFENARLTFAAHAWLAGSDANEGYAVPFYLMPSLGGNNTLRSYANFRFHDRNLLVGNLEMRMAIWDHLDGAVFVDAGNVGAKLGDLDFAKRSYGVGFRMHSKKATFVRLDVAHGSEGWRLTLNTSDPLHLSRLSRRTAPIPFVP